MESTIEIWQRNLDSPPPKLPTVAGSEVSVDSDDALFDDTHSDGVTAQMETYAKEIDDLRELTKAHDAKLEQVKAHCDLKVAEAQRQLERRQRQPPLLLLSLAVLALGAALLLLLSGRDDLLRLAH